MKYLAKVNEILAWMVLALSSIKVAQKSIQSRTTVVAVTTKLKPKKYYFPKVQIFGLSSLYCLVDLHQVCPNYEPMVEIGPALDVFGFLHKLCKTFPENTWPGVELFSVTYCLVDIY